MSKQALIPYLPSAQVRWDEIAHQLETCGCRLSIDVLNWEADFPYRPIAVVDVAYTEEGLLLHYFVRGLDLRALSAGDGNYVHEDSCVEFFMQREKGESYINFEFNVAGTSYTAHHKTIEESRVFSPEEFATIRRTGTHLGEHVDLSGDIHSWELSVLIPWTTMGYAPGFIPERLWANFYKCGDGTAHPHYLSWSPIEETKPAFHRPQFFGELIMEPR